MPGVDIGMDYSLAQHPTDQYVHPPKSAGNTFIVSCVFLLSHPRVLSAHDFLKLPPFLNSYRGSHSTHSSPFPNTVLAFALLARKKMFRIKFPSLASPFIELVCIHASHQSNTQHAGCDSVVSSYTDAFVLGFDLNPNEHIQ